MNAESWIANHEGDELTVLGYRTEPANNGWVRAWLVSPTPAASDRGSYPVPIKSDWLSPTPHEALERYAAKLRKRLGEAEQCMLSHAPGMR